MNSIRWALKPKARTSARVAVLLAVTALGPCCSVTKRGDKSNSAQPAPPIQAVQAHERNDDWQSAAGNTSAPAAVTEVLQQNLIMSGFPGGVDGVELGIGRNDGVVRLYGPATYQGSGYEWSFVNDAWAAQRIYSNLGTHCTPRLGDLRGQGNTLFMGIWDDIGVGTATYRDGWSRGGIVEGTTGKGRILSLKVGNGRSDGIQRLYLGSDYGLFEYSARGSGYEPQKVLDHAVGDFGMGDGRNDGTSRIYAGERGGSRLHELTWDGRAFRDEVIVKCDQNTEYAVHVGDGRGDQRNHVYAWCGRLVELTYSDGSWHQVIVDDRYAQRFYIRSGRVRSDDRSRLYVSQKAKGLMEYSWNAASQAYQVDVVTGATGGCAIGDGRGDGKNRLYVASGSNSAYSDAAVVELSARNPPPARR